MNVIKMLGIGLIVAGVLALVYGGFNYTKETTRRSSARSNLP